MSAKWQFIDPVTSSSYTFAVNANEDQTQHQKNLTFQAVVIPGAPPLLYEGMDQPTTLTLSGVLLSQTQWMNLNNFYNLRHQFQVVDDRGYVRWVYPYQLQGNRKNSATVPWRMDWSMQLYVLSDVFPFPAQS